MSTDVRRPAAIEQLSVLAQAGGRARARSGRRRWIRSRARSGALAEAKNRGFDIVIVDTAGRLHIDDELMDELQAIKEAVQPTDLLYVADAMTGQDAIKSAGEFNRRIGVTGVVLTKMDGDARGGAALSVVSASSACRSRLSAAASGCRISSRSIPIASCRACSAWATCCRSSRRPNRRFDRGDAEQLEEKIRHERLHARGFPRPAADHQEDGAARADPRDDSRAWAT